MSVMRPTIFLDRDGVINHDSSEYIKSPEEFHFIPKSPEAIALLNRHGFDVIIITNQSLIGRKWISAAVLDTIFDKMLSGVEKTGGSIKDIFFCPHTPDDGCGCRKPATGLIEQACEKYDIDPATSCMVGDSTKDILCGKSAGCGKTVLVLTGNGNRSKEELTALNNPADHTAADLFSAAQWISENIRIK